MVGRAACEPLSHVWREGVTRAPVVIRICHAKAVSVRATPAQPKIEARTLERLRSMRIESVSVRVSIFRESRESSSRRLQCRVLRQPALLCILLPRRYVFFITRVRACVWRHCVVCVVVRQRDNSTHRGYTASVAREYRRERETGSRPMNECARERASATIVRARELCAPAAP